MAYKRKKYKNIWVQGEEDVIQIQYFELVRFYEKQYPELEAVYAVPNGTFTNHINAEKAYYLGRRSGIWDINIDLPRGTYHGAKIEAKSPTGRLSKEQKKYQKLYIENNYLTFIGRSCDELWKFTLDYIGLLGLKNLYYGNYN